MSKLLTSDQEKVLRHAMTDVWNAIAPDAEEFVDSNEGVWEMVTDADRLLMAHDDGAAHRLFHELYSADKYKNADQVKREMIALIHFY